MMLMLVKYKFLKKNHTAQITRLNTLSDINDNDVIRPLCLRLPQMTGYARKFDKNATMSFRFNNKQLLKIIIKYGKNLKN